MTRRAPSPFDGFRLLGRRDSAPSLSAQMQAWLSTIPGAFAFDPTDVSTLKKDAAETLPVTTGADPVGCIISKFGAATYKWKQPTDASRLAWDGVGGLLFDGTSSHLSDFSDLTVAAGKSDIFIGMAAKVTSFVGVRALYNIGSTTLAAGRLAAFASNTAAMRVYGRRDTEGGFFCDSGAAALTAATKAVLTQRYKFTGSPTINSRKDGVQLANTDPFGVSAVTGGNSGRIYLGADVNSTNYLLGAIGRFVYVPDVVDNTKRALAEAWLAEGPL